MAALAVSRLRVCQTLIAQIRTRPTQSSLHLFARLTIWEMAGAREDGDPRIRSTWRGPHAPKPKR